MGVPCSLPQARCFSRLTGSDPGVLAVTTQLADRAAMAKPDQAIYRCELAYQLLLADNLAAAGEHYNAAVQLDELSMEGNYGAMECQILSSEVSAEEGEEQLMFLEEMASTGERNLPLGCLGLNALAAALYCSPLYLQCMRA